MKIWIYRGGSGWGGIEGEMFIDTGLKLAVTSNNLLKLYREFPKSSVFEDQARWLQSPSVLYKDIRWFDPRSIIEFDKDLSLLESFLEDCELHKERIIRFDQQIYHNKIQ